MWWKEIINIRRLQDWWNPWNFQKSFFNLHIFEQTESTLLHVIFTQFVFTQICVFNYLTDQTHFSNNGMSLCPFFSTFCRPSVHNAPTYLLQWSISKTLCISNLHKCTFFTAWCKNFCQFTQICVIYTNLGRWEAFVKHPHKSQITFTHNFFNT